jgi:excisionase family DNA binding protein
MVTEIRELPLSQNGVNRLAWSIAEFAEALGVSDGHIRNEIRRGNIHAFKSGKLILISNEEAHRYITEGSRHEAD